MREKVPFITGVILFIGLITTAFVKNSEIKDPIIITKIETDTIYIYIDTNYLFNEAIDHIKEYEGFRSKVYIDNDGSPTIGYGHHIHSNENLNYVTEPEAESLLIEDVKSKLSYINSNYKLSKNQALAMALFSFNLGSNAMDEAIKKGLLSNIDNKILRYCHYKVTLNGKKVVKRSKKLLERRKFELYIYNQ